MNWDAIGAVGELVGAVAVVATLVYFSLQVRSLSKDSYANSLNRVDEGERDLHKLMIEHATLVLLSNAAEELSMEQRYVLNEIYLSHYVFHLFAFLRAKTYGRDGSINARNMARTIEKYPCFLALFRDQASREDMGSGGVEFVNAVEDQLAEKGI